MPAAPWLVGLLKRELCGASCRLPRCLVPGKVGLAAPWNLVGSHVGPGTVRDAGSQTPRLFSLPSILFLFGTKTVFPLKELITRVMGQGEWLHSVFSNSHSIPFPLCGCVPAA